MRPRCLVAKRTRAPCAESQAPWGSWVSLAQYPGALAAPTCSPVSAPAPEPVRAGARSQRHVPHHLENEQVERGQQLCTHTLSQAAGGSWVSLAHYPVRERGRNKRLTLIEICDLGCGVLCIGIKTTRRDFPFYASARSSGNFTRRKEARAAEGRHSE